MKKEKNDRVSLVHVLIYSVIVLAIAFFTYFRNYDYPKQLFWDENYHIAASEKYLQGMFFMESHAPLGKMLIALGEYVIRPNEGVNKSAFLKTDYISTVPPGYSFAGVRFMPVMLATVGSVLFFLILFYVLGNVHFAALLSSLYLFENAFILHSRGAMLESSQMYFFFFSLLTAVMLLYKKHQRIRDYLVLGLTIGLSISIQWMGLVAVVAVPFLFFRSRSDFRAIRHAWPNLLAKSLACLLGIILPFLGFYYLHVFLGRRIVDNKLYGATYKYIDALGKGKAADPALFPVALRDNLNYVRTYNAGVPRSDICKYPDENGTTPWVWPVGNKAINYRWEKDGDAVRYLYLVGNPVIWATSLVAVFLAFALITARFVFGLKVTDERRFRMVALFFLMYVGFMTGMIYMEMSRAFYLYHYLMGLMIAIFLAVSLFGYLAGELMVKKSRPLYIGIIIFVLVVVAAYLFFSPFTYYQPLTTAEFELHNWFPFWRLKPIL